MSRPEVLNTLYVDIHHDPTPPGSSRPAGYWANQAWLSMPSAERKALQHPELARQSQTVVVLSSAQPAIHARYTPTDRCTSCRSAQASLKGKCYRCYHRDYMRTYHQRQQEHQPE